MKGIHVVTNGNLDTDQLALIPELMPYVDYLHLREKQKSANELHTMVKYLMEAGVSPNNMILNDRVDLARLMGCRGVQLAYHSLPAELVSKGFPDLLIGKSVHTGEEALKAEQDGADYLLYGHIFNSRSKPDLPPRGVEQLHSLCQSASIPVIAIGGITAANLSSVLKAGAKGVAIMSSVWNAGDPLEVLKEVRQSYNEWREANIAAL